MDLKISSYIYRVLKTVNPDTGITGKGAEAAETLVLILLGKLVAASNGVLTMTGKKTLSPITILTAVRLVLPGELANHGVSELSKAVTKTNAANTGGMKGSAARKAGLMFPPTRILNAVRSHSVASRFSSNAGAALAAVLEYITAEILELAGNFARLNKKMRININHIRIAIKNDEELEVLFHAVVFPGGSLGYSAVKESQKTQKNQKTLLIEGENDHPSWNVMIKKAVAELSSEDGKPVSSQRIRDYILASFTVAGYVDLYLKKGLARLTEKGILLKKGQSYKLSTEKTAAKKAAPKKAAPKETAAKKTVPKKAAPKKTVPKKAAPKKTVPKKAAPKETAAKKTVPKKTAAKKTVPKKTAAKKTVPKKTAAKK